MDEPDHGTRVDVNRVIARYQMQVASLAHDKIMAEARADTAEAKLAESNEESA
ncbi:hypothetical protein ACTXKN_12330 [Brachybacterium alimentarium]|uniref:hypothetical protein n=1 Tax=Brachybacterium alimentarium TaxID=47845 RepID=UPI003FD6A473